jgi:hypothetical protein
MSPGYLAKVAKALQSGRRFSDSDPTYLSDVTQLINQGLQKNTTPNQQIEQDKIDAYLKAYADKPEMIQQLLEFYQQNDWRPAQPARAWY